MKGNVLRPQWPASAPTNEKADQKASSTKQPDPMSRIKLALLDAYAEAGTGYDPYNTDTGRRNVWDRKPKRD